MASAIFNPPYSSHTSSSISPTICRKPPIYAPLSTSQISSAKTLTIRSITCVTHLRLTPFSSWNGLRSHGFSISLQSLKLEKRKKCKGKGVYASLFGVGAPEALVIGVVALLVFGPKGLAEVAKNLGKTLRAFQPTIRELQEVSREFKSTLEKEIGLDELNNPVQGNYTSRPSSTQVPPDTLQNSELKMPTELNIPTAPAATEDSPATTTAEVSPPTTTEDSPATTTTPAASPEVSQETPATTPVVTNEDSQPTVDTDPENGSSSSKAYSSEDLLKITEEQLKAAAAASQQQAPSSSEKGET